MTRSSRAACIWAVSLVITSVGTDLHGAGGSAQPPATDIFTAAAAGNVEAIGRHVAAGADLDVVDPASGATPLMVSALMGHTEAARLLIEGDASLSEKNTDGATALHIAAFFSHPDTVRLLLEHGADVSATNIRGETALDTVAGAWNDQLQGLYQMFAGMLQLDLDLERIEAARPVVADILRTHRGATAR